MIKLKLEALEPRRMLAAASFVESSQSLGLNGLLGGSGEYHAGGLTFTDLNRDGYADLYLIGPSSRGNRLYVNVDDGSGGRTFTRVAGDGGAAYSGGRSTGAVAADYDNDGDLDLYVTNFRDDNLLFKSMWMEDHASGSGTPSSLRFVDVTAATDPAPSNPAGDHQHGVAYATFNNPLFGNEVLDNTLAAAWADVNRDGWVDLYVGSWDGTNGNPNDADDGQLGERDTLYLNNGDGTFSDVTMGLPGSTPANVVRLLDDGSFELSTGGTQASNSQWVLQAPNNTAQFQDATWAASAGSKGVWFKGFVAGNAEVRQVYTAPVDGDYVLTFEARVESNFASAADGFQASLSSNGTGGSDSIDLLAAATDSLSHPYTLALAGVTAGDQLTIKAEMIDSVGGSGQRRSGFVDAFILSSPQIPGPDGWEQVGGWEDFEGDYNDPALPAEFSGQNGLQFADFNNDGWQDLVVATMGGAGVGPNRDMLYLNRGIDAAGDWRGYHQASYELGFGGEESSDMGVAVADIDNDGDLDYFSTLLPKEHPLWINNLSDTGVFTFTRTTITNDFSWGANFNDFDNNGRVDLLVGTDIDRVDASPTSYLHLQTWAGQFEEHGQAAGFSSPYSIRTVASADFDRDGFADVAQWTRPETNSPGIQFYRNASAAQNPNYHFLTVELEGDPSLPGPFKSSRDAIGARAYVTADFNGNGQIGADETRMEEVVSGHSNASTTSSLALEFGLGLATTADVRIVWSSGRTMELDDVAADQFVQLSESTLGSNGRDLLAVQRGLGTTTSVDDFTAWAASYGGDSGSAAASAAAAAASSAPSFVGLAGLADSSSSSEPNTEVASEAPSAETAPRSRGSRSVATLDVVEQDTSEVRAAESSDSSNASSKDALFSRFGRSLVRGDWADESASRP
ncbi:CRTAC1 family protein [Pirellulales bacterium]|nr:CRTAC1 family protein [Pirellulales bacterium]